MQQVQFKEPFDLLSYFLIIPLYVRNLISATNAVILEEYAAFLILILAAPDVFTLKSSLGFSDGFHVTCSASVVIFMVFKQTWPI